MILKTIDDLIERSTYGWKKRIAVVAAHDTHTLEALKIADQDGLVLPVLLGDADRIQQSLVDIGGFKYQPEIVSTKDDEESAARAVAMVKDGKADFIMKGNVNSSTLLRPVVRKEGLNVGNTISHLTMLSLPAYHKLVGLTDCAMNIQPTLEQKVSIVKNAVSAFNRIGYEAPKVALICANEEVTLAQQDTVDARAIQDMAERGELGGCIVSGPISFDIAMDAKAAQTKGFDSPVAGDADILVVPNLVCGNVLNKAFKQFGQSLGCGTVIGAQCPIVLTSRTSQVRTKFLSIVLSASMI